MSFSGRSSHGKFRLPGATPFSSTSFRASRSRKSVKSKHHSYSPVAIYSQVDSEFSDHSELIEAEGEEEDTTLDELCEQDFYSSPQRQPLNRHFVPSPSELARAELDGNQPRVHNPLTIIQVKNPEKNADFHSDSPGPLDRLCPFVSPLRGLRSLAHMSTPRKWSFALSVLACLGFMLVFLWAIPCPDGAKVCRSTSPNEFHDDYLGGIQLDFDPSAPAALYQRTMDWSRIFSRTVLTSGLQVVHKPASDSAPASTVLVAGYVSSGARSTEEDTGLIGIEPRKGQELWRQPLYALPKQMDCHYLDVNSDGAKDCLVIGDKGLLAAIDPIKGEELWFLHHHIPLVNLSLPRFLPDLNGDGIPELLSSCAVTLPSGISDHRTHVRTNLVIISGRDGKVIGRSYLVGMCLDIGAVNITTHLNVQFDCLTRSGPDQFEMTMEELYRKVTNNRALPLPILQRNGAFGEFYQFTRLGVDLPSTEKDSIHMDITPIREESPEYGVTVRVWDGFAHRTLWNHTWYRAVAFQPQATRFETDRWDSPIEGFVFRLWQWRDNTQDTFTRGRLKPQPIRTSPTPMSSTGAGDSAHGAEEEEEEEDYAYDIVFKHGGHQPESYDSLANDDDYYTRNQQRASDWIAPVIPFGGGRRLMSLPRTTPLGPRPTTSQPVQGPGQPQKRTYRIQESIYYIVLNHSTPSLQRVFSHEIVQHCAAIPDNSQFSCDPHFNTQPNTMVIIPPDDLRSEDANEWRDLVFSSQFWSDAASVEQPRTVKPDGHSETFQRTEARGHSSPLKRTLLKKLRLAKSWSEGNPQDPKF